MEGDYFFDIFAKVMDKVSHAQLRDDFVIKKKVPGCPSALACSRFLQVVIVEFCCRFARTWFRSEPHLPRTSPKVVVGKNCRSMTRNPLTVAPRRRGTRFGT